VRLSARNRATTAGPSNSAMTTSRRIRSGRQAIAAVSASAPDAPIAHGEERIGRQRSFYRLPRIGFVIDEENVKMDHRARLACITRRANCISRASPIS
jgi:hypothetical protein